jgi:hypothetical protein
MKKVNIFIFTVFLLVFTGGFSACKEKNNDLTPLIGEWSITKFAYTDGNNILNEVIISNCMDSTINISDAVDYAFSMYFKICNYVYSRSGDRITYIQKKSSCWQVIVSWTDEEMEIANALQNAYKFVIKNNELMIYFTGNETKNLLILKNDKL